jgi:hypothetical protein
MSEKITGYVLLIAGILVIAFSAFSVYQVFTRQAQPVKLFSLKGVSVNANQIISGAPANGQIDLISASDLNTYSNIAAHLILMSFLAGIGSRVAVLGVQMLRPIEVKLSQAKPQ